ncbi:MAG: hypothetical protein U0736_03795 [Gemmataceae bacterium]
MEQETAQQPEKKYYREATPEEMAHYNRQADAAERYHFGFGVGEEPQIDAIPPQPSDPGTGGEADVSPSVVVIVDKTRCEGQ